MKRMEQITALFLAAMLSLFLLAVDGSGYTAITALKFRLLAGLTALWLCGLVWCGRKHRLRLKREKALILMMVLTMNSVIRTLMFRLRFGKNLSES